MCCSDLEGFEAPSNAFLIPAYHWSLSELVSPAPLGAVLSAQLCYRKISASDLCFLPGKISPQAPVPVCTVASEVHTTSAPCLSLSYTLRPLALGGMRSWPCQALLVSLGWQVSFCSAHCTLSVQRPGHL